MHLAAKNSCTLKQWIGRRASSLSASSHQTYRRFWSVDRRPRPGQGQWAISVRSATQVQEQWTSGPFLGLFCNQMLVWNLLELWWMQGLLLSELSRWPSQHVVVAKTIGFVLRFIAWHCDSATSIHSCEQQGRVQRVQSPVQPFLASAFWPLSSLVRSEESKLSKPSSERPAETLLRNHAQRLHPWVLDDQVRH